MEFQRYISSSILICTTVFLSSCSAFSGGDGDSMGDAGSAITDEDLALQGGDSRYNGGNIPLAASRNSGPFSDIFFGYDAAGIDQQYHDMLKSSSEELIKDPSLKAEVEGHCDSRGTQEYNLALGEERAKSAQRMLVQFGANPKQITTISYGEEIPLEQGQNESAYAKNRRVHFALFRNKN